MPKPKITLTWNSLPVTDTELSFLDSLTGIEMSLVFQPFRLETGKTPIGNEIISSIKGYIRSFNLDYNNALLYKLTIIGEDSLEIESVNDLSVFSLITNSTDGAISLTTEVGEPALLLDITDLSFSESVTPCDTVTANVTSNEQADELTSPFTQTVTSNPFSFDLNRSPLEQFISIIKDGITSSKKVRVPKLLASYFNIDILTTPVDGIINVEKLTPLTLTSYVSVEYSTDGDSWQTSSYFNGLSVGDYTLYIRDNLGCTVTKSFSISEFDANLLDYEGIAEISNINSIRYKNLVEWSDTLLKTSENTLSFEENDNLRNKEYLQLFEQRDIIPTQLKSNYETITAKIIDKYDNETALFVYKKTANMNINDVRDVSITEVDYLGSSYCGVSYSGGKTYDPITLTETGDYDLGANLPDWINKDDYININGVGWYKIIDTIYLDGSYIAVINLLASDFPFTLSYNGRATTVYNTLDYENYEFDINFSSIEGFYKVQVDFSDSSFGSKQFLSEWLYIKEKHNNTFLIQAYNTENNEINFNTGFKSLMRLPLAKPLEWSPNTEIDVYVTDTNTVNLDSKYRSFWELTSKLLPTVIAEKLVLLLLQDRLFINNISYKTEGDPGSNKIGAQYQITANLVKTNYVFELYSGKGEITIDTDKTPLSISSDGGFLLVR